MERKEKTGLVLEGGGMRGIYTAGVLDVFLEKGIALTVLLEYLQEWFMDALIFLDRRGGAFAIISDTVGTGGL